MKVVFICDNRARFPARARSRTVGMGRRWGVSSPPFTARFYVQLILNIAERIRVAAPLLGTLGAGLYSARMACTSYVAFLVAIPISIEPHISHSVSSTCVLVSSGRTPLLVLQRGR